MRTKASIRGHPIHPSLIPFPFAFLWGAFAFVVAAQAEELQVDQMKLLHVGGRRIVVARTEDGYVAFDDGCTHKGGSLAGGTMICGTVQCPWHGSQFDARTGSVKAGPAKEGIKTYRVEERGSELRLVLPQE